MLIDPKSIRHYRLCAHHLDKKIPPESILEAAGACGLQNSPPGAWETALFNRLEGYPLQELRESLYARKILLQAWSYRGIPVVFPTDESSVFLSSLIARQGEEPWIYTRGITAALDFLGMPLDALLPLVRKAAAALDNQVVKSKESLDRMLAEIVRRDLPPEKKALWDAPSLYGSPDRQTMGGAVVSFLLRPCSFYSLVVFGERQADSPTFTSFRNWTGHEPVWRPEAEKALVRKFLHCYGPATRSSFVNWLGASPRQAARLWDGVAEEMEPIQTASGTGYILSADRERLLSAPGCGERLILLGAHDPYLDMRDRDVILDQRPLHKSVWKTVANPGVILRDGRIVGIWKAKTLTENMEISITLWESLSAAEQRRLADLAEEYAAFRLLSLRKCAVESP